jgi:DNA-directed RNA polymerase specialized sigma24 family protein
MDGKADGARPTDARGAEGRPVGKQLDRMIDAMGSLPVRWRTLLWHVEVLGEPATTIGHALGLEEDSIPTLLAEAYADLRAAYARAAASSE